jgi:uncharacterized protein DUF4386
MTLRTNARVAGFTFFIYFVAGIGELMLSARGPANSLLTITTSFSALVLGVTLYAITREQDQDLAMLGLGCRVLEAVPGEGAIYFAVGSLIFSWLFLRGRMIPVALAWLGVAASAFLVVIIPLQRAGLFGGSLGWASGVTWFMYLPMLVFELTLATWFIVKGVAAPAQRQLA